MLTTLLRSLKEMQGYAIHATDGDIGKVYDFYFDDDYWTIRYLVADTGHWLPGRKVLISPFVFEEPDWEHKKFPVRISREAVEKSPEIDAATPVSRQKEKELAHYYNWPAYWGMTEIGNLVVPVPAPLPISEAPPKKKQDAHLRNVREVLGDSVQALDGSIGHVDDFIVNDADWGIHYIVIDTGNVFAGKKVLISPWWVDDIRWEDSKMVVHIPKETIRKSPEYIFSSPVSRDYEDRLYDYYGKPKYWK